MELVQLELLKDLFHDVFTDLKELVHPPVSLPSEISLLIHQHKNTIWLPKEKNIPR